MRKVYIFFICLLFALACTGGGGEKTDAQEGDLTQDAEEVSEVAESDAQKEKRRFVILHTNDLHSHLTGTGPENDFTPDKTGDDAVKGGFARIAAKIKEIRQSTSDPVLLIDAGDFSMGTLFEILELTDAPELSLFSELGYDYATIGNHEFDWGPEALAGIIGAFNKKNPGTPLNIVASNLIFDDASPKDDSLKALFDGGVIKQHHLKTLENGLKIGVFGLLGKDAADVAPFKSPVKIEDPVKAAEKMVKILKDEGAEVIICVSHSGVGGLQSEDEKLAEGVQGIDIIVGGHSHTALLEGMQKGNTMIVQAGYYGLYLGRLDVEVSPDGSRFYNAGLMVINDDIAGDADTNAAVKKIKDKIDAMLLPAGLGFDKVIAETDFDVVNVEFDESPVGDLITDAILHIVNLVQPEEKVIAAFEANGQLRADIVKGVSGKILLADLFRVFPLGIGPDLVAGYPVVAFYATGAEIKSGLEVITSVVPLKGDIYYVQFSGLKVKYDTKQPLFDRIREIYVGDSATPLDTSKENKTLYRVATDIYIAAMFSVLKDYTYGFLELIPKDKNGNPVGDLETLIVDRDPSEQGIQELKVWETLVMFLKTFGDKDLNGIPDVPDIYKKSQGRISEIE